MSLLRHDCGSLTARHPCVAPHFVQNQQALASACHVSPSTFHCLQAGTFQVAVAGVRAVVLEVDQETSLLLT